MVQHGLQVLGQGADDGVDVETHPLQGLLLDGQVLAAGPHLHGRWELTHSKGLSPCPGLWKWELTHSKAFPPCPWHVAAAVQDKNRQETAAGASGGEEL